LHNSPENARQRTTARTDDRSRQVPQASLRSAAVTDGRGAPEVHPGNVDTSVVGRVTSASRQREDPVSRSSSPVDDRGRPQLPGC